MLLWGIALKHQVQKSRSTDSLSSRPPQNLKARWVPPCSFTTCTGATCAQIAADGDPGLNIGPLTMRVGFWGIWLL